MLLNRPPILVILLFFILLGNVFGFVKLMSNPQDFMTQYPRITPFMLDGLKLIQVLNVLSIVGMWMGKKWGVWLAIALSVAVLGADLYVPLYYHIVVVLISVGLTMWQVFKHWHLFR